MSLADGLAWERENGYPDGNPKTALGSMKVPLHLVPPSAIHYLALAFADGARKYGPYNWREKGVSATVYLAALKRHADAYLDGEDVSADALVHHLGHVMACCAIILDADSVGKLNDDRPPRGAAARLQAEYAESARTAKALDSVSMDVPAIVSHSVAAAYLRDVAERDDDLPGHPFQDPDALTGHVTAPIGAQSGGVVDVTKGPYVPNPINQADEE